VKTIIHVNQRKIRVHHMLPTYSALAMPSPMTVWASNGGNRTTEAIAATTPTAAEAPQCAWPHDRCV